MMTLGEKLKELREEKGYTKAALTRKAGLNSHTVINIESGKVTSPSMIVMIRISEVLDVPIDIWVPYIKALNAED